MSNCTWTLKSADLCTNTDYLTESCQNANIRLLKTVRLRVSKVEKLMRDYSNLKVVVLFRDPKAVMASRQAKKWCGFRNQNCTNAFYICQQMENDLNGVEILEEKFPGRITSVQFDDFILQPYESTWKIFNLFLKLPMPENFKWIFLHFIETHTGILHHEKIPEKVIEHETNLEYKQRSYKLLTMKKDSREVNEKWQYRLGPGTIENIDEKCSGIMSRLRMRKYLTKVTNY